MLLKLGATVKSDQGVGTGRAPGEPKSATPNHHDRDARDSLARLPSSTTHLTSNLRRCCRRWWLVVIALTFSIVDARFRLSVCRLPPRPFPRLVPLATTMARLNTSINPSKSPSQSSIYRDPTPPGEPSSTARRPARSTRSAFSPSAGSSSDKENSGDPMSSPRLTMDKGKGRARSPTTFPTPTSEENQTPRPNKRRRLQDRDRSARDASTAPIQNGDSITGTEFYDPEQDPEERRRLREEQRNLQRDFNGESTRFLQGVRH